MSWERAERMRWVGGWWWRVPTGYVFMLPHSFCYIVLSWIINERQRRRRRRFSRLENEYFWKTKLMYACSLRSCGSTRAEWTIQTDAQGLEMKTAEYIHGVENLRWNEGDARFLCSRSLYIVLKGCEILIRDFRREKILTTCPCVEQRVNFLANHIRFWYVSMENWNIKRAAAATCMFVWE